MYSKCIICVSKTRYSTIENMIFDCWNYACCMLRTLWYYYKLKACKSILLLTYHRTYHQFSWMNRLLWKQQQEARSLARTLLPCMLLDRHLLKQSVQKELEEPYGNRSVPPLGFLSLVIKFITSIYIYARPLACFIW